MYCIIAVVYLILLGLLIGLSNLEGFQLWVLLIPFSESMLAIAFMNYPASELKCNIKLFRKCSLEVLRWTLLVILVYKIINVYTIIIFTSEIWVWWMIELLQPKISERITYV